MTPPDDGGQQQGQQQQGDGQQGGSQDSGQQGGTQQQQGQQQSPPPPNTDAIAAAARRDGEANGYANAAKELGVSIEEAKRILDDHKKRSDAEKTATERLTEREGELTTANAEKDEQKKRADRYEKIVKASVESQLENVEDDAIKDLLSGMDVGGQFEWLTKHGAKYVKAPEGQDDGGQDDGKQDDGQQQRRKRGAEDTTPQDNAGKTLRGRDKIRNMYSGAGR